VREIGSCMWGSSLGRRRQAMDLPRSRGGIGAGLPV
jgi:hypothetical protein